jgi:hypothetical protein
MRLYLKTIHSWTLELEDHKRQREQQQEEGQLSPFSSGDRSFSLREAVTHFDVELDEEWEERIGELMDHRFTSCKFAEVAPLQSHIQDWTKEDLQDWHKHKTFLKNFHTAIFGQHQQEQQQHQHFSMPDDQSILPLISAFDSNNFGIWSAKGEVLGRSIYPRASYFNHSCDPNCYTERKGPILFIVAEGDIKAGLTLFLFPLFFP